MTLNQIKNRLAQHYGTENYYRFRFLGVDALYTDWVQETNHRRGETRVVNSKGNTQMKIDEVIGQLRYLAMDRESFFHDDNDPNKDDDAFRQDHKALTIAVKLLGLLSKTVNDCKTIIGGL